MAGVLITLAPGSGKRSGNPEAPLGGLVPGTGGC